MKIDEVLIHQIKLLIDPDTLLNYLGFSITKSTSKEIRAACKIHGGDNSTAFKMDKETKTWVCFTRHCEDEARDVVALVQKTMNLGFVDSVKLLADLTGLSSQNEETKLRLSELKRQVEIDKEIRNVRSYKPISAISTLLAEELVREHLGNRFGYFESRGFSSEILDFYEVGGTIDSRGIPRETIPIRDEDGSLVSISGRDITDSVEEKYKVEDGTFKGNTLYNIHIAKHYLGNSSTLILVEGFSDVWNFVSNGVFNVVACMGTSVSAAQVRLLWKYANNVVLLFDPDSAGRKAEKRAKEILERGVNVITISLPDGKDPKKLSLEEIALHLGEYANG